jgi:hypothetical protein
MTKDTTVFEQVIATKFWSKSKIDKFFETATEEEMCEVAKLDATPMTPLVVLSLMGEPIRSLAIATIARKDLISSPDTCMLDFRRIEETGSAHFHPALEKHRQDIIKIMSQRLDDDTTHLTAEQLTELATSPNAESRALAALHLDGEVDEQRLLLDELCRDEQMIVKLSAGINADLTLSNMFILMADEDQLIRETGRVRLGIFDELDINAKDARDESELS